jgi:hypothetical protein
MSTADSCRWASYIGEPVDKAHEDLVALPTCEQMARGQELMQMLKERESVVSEVSPAAVGKEVVAAWNVIVKQTFIEVLIPPCNTSRRRCLSDSALSHFENSGKPWKSIEDLSDASTSVSLEAEDADVNFPKSPKEDMYNSREEAREAFFAPVAPQQYAEPWWMTVSHRDAPTEIHHGHSYDGVGASHADSSWSMGYGSSMSSSYVEMPMRYDQASTDNEMYSFAPQRWADHSIDAQICRSSPTDAAPREWRTTVMIRSMPNYYTRTMVLELVDKMGFAGLYDFVYVPVDFQSQTGLGYALVDFGSSSDAQLCFERFEGFTNWATPSDTVCTVAWSCPTQGRDAHIERYRNSPVMHHSLPDEWRPVLFQNGMRIAFPSPSKSIKAPKVRTPKNADN